MREQLKIWFQSAQSRVTNVEMHIEEKSHKTEIAIIGKNYAASVEMTEDSICDLSLVSLSRDEIVSFQSTTFTDRDNLIDELDQLISKMD